MRSFDKIKNIRRANILAEQRYLQSKGLIEESSKNLKDVVVNIPDEYKLKLIKNTPAFSNLFPTAQLNNLKVGDNKLTVNHYIYSKIINKTDPFTVRDFDYSDDEFVDNQTINQSDNIESLLKRQEEYLEFGEYDKADAIERKIERLGGY